MNRRSVVIAGAALIIAISALVFIVTLEDNSERTDVVTDATQARSDPVAESEMVGPQTIEATPPNEPLPLSEPEERTAAPVEYEYFEDRRSWHADLEGSYAKYLESVMQTPERYEKAEPEDCRSPDYYLIEMELESRNDQWAAETERALYDWWRPIDEQNERADISVTCHASICRVVMYSEVPPIGDRNAAWEFIWVQVDSTFPESAIAERFKKIRYTLRWLINGDVFMVWVLVGKNRDFEDEPAYCNNLNL